MSEIEIDIGTGNLINKVISTDFNYFNIIDELDLDFHSFRQFIEVNKISDIQFISEVYSALFIKEYRLLVKADIFKSNQFNLIFNESEIDGLKYLIKTGNAHGLYNFYKHFLNGISNKPFIKFDMPKNQSSIIKVIGVGVGGSNAVNHMYRQGIKGVDFIICNTDAQAMESSPVPTKIQLGERGLGAGSIPAVGKEVASQKVDQIKEILEKNTQMVFITAGMGGGTGTGAAPVIAEIAKSLGILTVAIVTIPFTFEGKKRKFQANDGILELRKHADTMLIICNDNLRKLYGDLKPPVAFDKADDVLTIAAKSIAEIITVTGYINVDFEDVKTVLINSGKAIMGYAQAEGENRALEAVKAALSSPLLNDNDIEGASNLLLYITSGEEEISMDEVKEITDYIQQEAKSQAEIIWGNGYDDSLGKQICITLIATGFDTGKKETAKDKIIKYKLKGGKLSKSKLTFNSVPSEEKIQNDDKQVYSHKREADDRFFIFEFDQESTNENLENEDIPDNDSILYIQKLSELPDSEKQYKRPTIDLKSEERIERLRNLTLKLRNEQGMEALENESEYVRYNTEIKNTSPSEEEKDSKYSLSEDIISEKITNDPTITSNKRITKKDKKK